jgi:uncharacterized protein DUF3306
MSEPENFLARWSRRKRKAADPAEDPAAKEATVEKKEEPADKAASATEPARESEVPFDLSSLPPVESIVAGTDIRAFLAPGVPAELTRAALRRAWTTDPGIRDFIGLSENAWDFTKGGPTGFGPLLPIDDVKKLVAELFSGPEDKKTPRKSEGDSTVVAALDPPPSEPQSRSIEKRAETPPVLQSNMIDQEVIPPDANENDALQNESETTKRTHGGALPE